MCNDLIINDGGICSFCNVWSVQQRQFYECWDVCGVEAHTKEDWECDWPEGHPTGKSFQDRALYELGRSDDDQDHDLTGPCIRCESEEVWDDFLNRMAVDHTCPEYFENYVYAHHPESLNEDPDYNKWWRRPYKPTRLADAGFGYHTWRDPVDGKRQIRDVEGPFKYHQHKHFMVTQEEHRTRNSFQNYVERLQRTFDMALLLEHADQAQEIQEIRHADHIFRQRHADREDYPEQPYLYSGFEYLEEDYLYPDYSEVPPYEQEDDSDYESESMDVDDPPTAHDLLPPQPRYHEDYNDFFEAAECEVYEQ